MIFVKSVLTGLFSLIAVGILLLISIWVSLIPQMSPGTAVGIDIVSFVRSFPITWILVVLAFALGFHWKYRRLKLRQGGRRVIKS